MTTKIIIEFDSNKYEIDFLGDVKEYITWSSFKPKNLTITMKEEIE